MRPLYGAQYRASREGGNMGVLGKLFKRSKREELLVTPPTSKPKPPRVVRAGSRRTRTQVVGRRRAMAGRKVNVQRLRKERAS